MVVVKSRKYDTGDDDHARDKMKPPERLQKRCNRPGPVESKPLPSSNDKEYGIPIPTALGAQIEKQRTLEIN
jgi:hypothetical protein